jgi:exonuclease III
MTSQKLKIATWNLNRPTSQSNQKKESILRTLHKIDADVLVLSETNSCIDMGASYRSFQTTSLFQSLSIGGEQYQEGENRVTIWTKLPAQRRVDMCNSHSAICVQVTTDWGDLNVYGTVIGIYGKNRFKNESKSSQTDFERTLDVQLADWQRLANIGNLCITGDFNLSLADNYYTTEEHRKKLLGCFQGLGVTVPTKDLANNVDHIALSARILADVVQNTGTWTDEVSDHQGVWLTLEKNGHD